MSSACTRISVRKITAASDQLTPKGVDPQAIIIIIIIIREERGTRSRTSKDTRKMHRRKANKSDSYLAQ